MYSLSGPRASAHSCINRHGVIVAMVVVEVDSVDTYGCIACCARLPAVAALQAAALYYLKAHPSTQPTCSTSASTSANEASPTATVAVAKTCCANALLRAGMSWPNTIWMTCRCLGQVGWWGRAFSEASRHEHPVQDIHSICRKQRQRSTWAVRPPYQAASAQHKQLSRAQIGSPRTVAPTTRVPHCPHLPWQSRGLCPGRA